MNVYTPIKSVAIATSHEKSEKEVRIVHHHANTHHFTKKMLNISTVDPEIIVLKLSLKNKEINASKICSQVAQFAKWAKLPVAVGIKQVLKRHTFSNRK